MKYFNLSTLTTPQILTQLSLTMTAMSMLVVVALVYDNANERDVTFTQTNGNGISFSAVRGKFLGCVRDIMTIGPNSPSKGYEALDLDILRFRYDFRGASIDLTTHSVNTSEMRGEDIEVNGKKADPAMAQQIRKQADALYFICYGPPQRDVAILPGQKGEPAFPRQNF